MKHVLFLLSLLVVACGSSEQSSELEPYILDFEESYDVVIDFRVVFEDHGEDDWSGECRIRPWKKRVFIDPDSWAALTSEYARRMLVFHELGHCVFWLKHDEGELILEDGTARPLSYMWSSNPQEQAAFHDPDLIDYYTEELRSRIYFTGKESALGTRGPD